MELLSFTCPRCNKDVEERFYGPCGSCVGELRATQQKDRKDVADEAFEPKMNVVPNAIASKE